MKLYNILALPQTNGKPGMDVAMSPALMSRALLSLACLCLAAMATLGAGRTLAADTQAPDVVASIPPIHSLVAQVMDGVGEPHLLVKGGQSPHTYAMRPMDAKALESADLVIWVGPEVEGFLTKPLDVLARNADVLTLIDSPGMMLLPIREGGDWDEHNHDHGCLL